MDMDFVEVVVEVVICLSPSFAVVDDKPLKTSAKYEVERERERGGGI